MSDKKVSQLEGTTTVNPYDLVMIVQDGNNKKVPLSVFSSNLNGPKIASGFLSVTSKNVSNGGSFLPVDKAIIHVKNTGTDFTKSLPDGAEGQVLTIIAGDITSPFSVVPQNSAGFQSIQFNQLGDSASLLFTDSLWYITSAFNVDIQ